MPGDRNGAVNVKGTLASLSCEMKFRAILTTVNYWPAQYTMRDGVIRATIHVQ